MHFRPMPALTVFALLALALLLTLGVWQLQRMEWKAQLMAQYEARGEVSSFRDALCGESDGPFSPSIDAPAPLSGAQLRLYESRQGPGWLRLSAMPAPACAGEGRYLLVESGWEALAGGRFEPTERWRITPLTGPSWMDAPNNAEANEWHAFDRPAMEQALDLPPGALLDVWARSDALPPASFERTTPATHLGYALTWFGLAGTLIAVYLGFHAARGRLSLRR